ncbi:MAG: DNA translocase FtsK 4TM domain-containing protein [Lachnospiraceae bacterium]
MASNVTGKNTAQKKSSSAVNRKKSAGTEKKADSGYRTDKKNSTDKNSTGKRNGTAQKGSSVEKNNIKKEEKTFPASEDGDNKKLLDEVRFLVAVGITILLTMCNFHYCMGVGNAVYFVLHGLFGCLAYVLPFVLLGAYLFMIPNRGNQEAWMKTRLCLLLFLECCFLFHFIGMKETQPFSPVYYFLAGQSGINGGLVGGLFSGLLQHLIGTMATIFIIFLMMLITVIIFTERSAVRTVQMWAGAVRSLTGGRFQRLREKMQEWFSDDEEDDYYDDYYDDDDYDIDDRGSEDDNKDDSGRETAGVRTHAKEKSDDDMEKAVGDSTAGGRAANPTGTGSRSGRYFTWNRKPAGMTENPAEYFTQKFPFMTEKEKSSEKPVSDEASGSEKRTGSDKYTREARTEASLFDENWRKGFASSRSGQEAAMAETGPEQTGFRQSRTESGPTVSRDGRPGTTAGRIYLKRDLRSLEEMGFEHIPSEDNSSAAGSIDDFIVYNGIAAEEEWSEPPEDTYPFEDDMEPEDGYLRAENVEPEDGYPQAENMEPENGYPQADNVEPVSEDAYSYAENMDPVPEEEEPLSESADSGETGERAIDLTEHVVLPEDGPVVWHTPESAGGGLMPSAGGTGQGSVSGNTGVKSSGGIWKQDSGAGSRGSSGAVTFSSKPKVPEKKPVVKKPYVYPPSSLLKRNMAFNGKTSASNTEIKDKLYQTLQNFGVNVKMGEVSVGPAVTRYELEPEAGVKVSRIVALQDDIKLALAAPDIRIEAPIPGKSAIGIEVPNRENTVVGFRELIESDAFQNHPSKVAMAVGRDISGQIVVADLARMPHLLIAGATGSGKSVCINTLIMSIIYKASPEEVKLVMVDPKVVELSIYNGIPHLLVPVVTDARKAANALRWAVEEMNDRYKKFAEYNVRNIEGYNEHLKKEKAKDPSNEEPYLYQMVIIVDELADLMMVAQGEVEEAICRLAQMARAAGIHLVLATQRPSVNVITGLIKANVPSRIAFAVSSGVDSRTIIDMNGAEKLLGKGDMLFYPYGIPKPVRVQGAFISDEEVSRVVTWLHKNSGGVSGQEMMEKMITSASENAAVRTERDEYFESAGRFIIEKDKASIGALQRNFKIGFNRAARIMDQLAAAGVVGEEDGTKPRKILMSMDEFNQFMDAD